MSWYVYGNGKHLYLNVDVDHRFTDGSGQQRTVAARASSHEPRPYSGLDDPLPSWMERSSPQLLDQLTQAECNLAIYPTSSAHGAAVVERVPHEPDKEHVAIHFHAAGSLPGQERDQVNVSIALPPPDFEPAWELFRLVLREPHLGYMISVDFPGFRRARAAYPAPAERSAEEELVMGNPSSDEFLRGTPYVSNRVGLSLQRFPRARAANHSDLL